MKHLLFPLFLLCLFSTAHGQLSGRLRGPEGSPIPFANVLLLKAGDSALIKAVLTDTAGIYRFDNPGPGPFILRYSSAGFQSQSTPVFNPEDSGQTGDRGTIILQPSTAQLGAFVVRAEKPLFQQQSGGMVVNVENSPLTKGSSALAVLERSPGVMIDHQNNNIALNGKSGVAVMLNGKLVRMPMEQLVTLLNGMSADNIDRIELLTTPPAGYDADGSAGIINIVTKKNRKKGTNGSYSLTGGYGWGEKASANLNLAHNGKTTVFYGSYNYFHDRTYSDITGSGSQDFPPLGGKMDVLFWGVGRPVQNNHDISAGFDSRISARTTIGGNIGFNSTNTSSTDHSISAYNVLPDSLLLFKGTNRGENHWKNWSSSLYLEKQFARGQKLLLAGDLLYYRNNGGALIESSFINKHGDGANTADSTYSPLQQSSAHSSIRVGTFKMDYSKQWNPSIRLEAGVKGSFAKDQNESGIQSFLNDAWITNEQAVNNMVMNEGIGAAYSSLTAQLDPDLSLVAGLRYEYSRTRMKDVVTGLTTLDRKLGAFFPSLSLTKRLSNGEEWFLSYTKRISRPTYNDLTSYVGYSDPVAVYTGNPLLRPTITHNLKLGTNYKGYSFSVLLSRDDYPIARYQLGMNPAGNILYILPQNLNYQKYLTLQASLPFKPFSWWSMNYGFAGGWREFQLDYTVKPVQKSYFAYSMNFTQTFRLPSALSLELSGFYNSLSYNGAMISDVYGSLSAGLKKELKGNGGTLQLSVTDLLRSMSYNGSHGHLTTEVFDTRNQFQYNPESRQSPIFRISWTKSFGSGSAKTQTAEKTGSGEEKERVRKD